jgi:DNA adenine methylase
LQKTLLRWAGSKKKLVPHLAKYFTTEFNRYLEPFVGSGQLFFNLPVQTAILSDINISLVQMYNTVRQNPDEVHACLSLFRKGKEEYYALRAKDISACEEIYKASVFIYLNTYCFNGLYRTNLSGKFNVPYSESSGNIIGLKDLRIISEYLDKAEILNGDFEKIVNDNCQAGDFVYLDPPYAVKNKRIFNQYSPDTFGLNDLQRLRTLIDEIDRRGAKFVLSYAECDEANFLSEGWQHEKVTTVRNISGFSKHRKMESEVIITNIN